VVGWHYYTCSFADASPGNCRHLLGLEATLTTLKMFLKWKTAAITEADRYMEAFGDTGQEQSIQHRVKLDTRQLPTQSLQVLSQNKPSFLYF